MSPETRIISNPRNRSRQASQWPRLLKCRRGAPGACLHPTGGPFALAGAPSVCVPGRAVGTSRRVRCAINAAARRRLGSRYRSFPRKGRRAGGEETGEIGAGGEVTNPRIHCKVFTAGLPAAQVKPSARQKHSVAGFSRASLGLFVWRIDLLGYP